MAALAEVADAHAKVRDLSDQIARETEAVRLMKSSRRPKFDVLQRTREIDALKQELKRRRDALKP